MSFSLRKTLFVLCVAGLGGCLAAQTPPAAKTPAPAPPAAKAKKSAFDKAELEAYLRHRNLWLPAEVKVEIGDPKPSQQLPGMLEIDVRLTFSGGSLDDMYFVSKDGQKIVKGDAFDIAQNPFKQDLDKLKTEFQPSFGTPGASVVIVLFGDFECPACKPEAKMLRDNLLSVFPAQVRLYFKDFPIEQLHPWAKMASIAGHCIYRQNPLAFWEYFDWIYEHQAEITAADLQSKVVEFAKTKENEIDVLQLNRCLEARATEAEVNKNMDDGHALQVMATPTMFVNGRRLQGQIDWPRLEKIVENEIEYQKTAKNAGEDCGCEIKAPSLLSK
jgi:protein-disulfide isomerase